MPDLVAATGAQVWGAASDAHRLPPLDHALSPGDTMTLGDAQARIIDVSGHTIGHIAYLFDGLAFTGDSLMAGGCGRLFEGTPDQMHASLSQFAALPGDTSTLDTERNTNPFLRAHEASLKAATGTTGQSDENTFAAARCAKDAF